ncbi:hypothetical protein [Mycobacterium dioxanotrophicus]|nr:hypothetical protein [Mycobacterium dioxanotrophicus]
MVQNRITGEKVEFETDDADDAIGARIADTHTSYAADRIEHDAVSVEPAR